MQRYFCLLIIILISQQGAADSIMDWHGEWGEWTSEKNGASITIFECTEETKTCRFRYQSETALSRCSTSGDNGSVIRITGDSGSVQFLSYDGDPNDCFLELKLEKAGARSAIHLLSHRGKECISFCTEHKLNFPTSYPKKTSIIFPQLFTRECFYDKRKSREVWCGDPKLEGMDQTLREIGESIDRLLHTNNMHEAVQATREKILKSCDIAANIEECLFTSYNREMRKLEEQKAAAEKQRNEQEAALGTPGDKSKASELIRKIDGVYKSRFENELVDGSQFTSENILEIVRVTDNAIYFRTHLEFFNGHLCDLYGVAEYSSAGTFVFNDAEEPLYEGETCRLQIQITDKDIVLLDPEYYCKNMYCGARGAFDETAFPLSSRRPIRYMDILKNSEEYKESVSRMKK